MAVISYNYWTRRFEQNPAVIGKVVQIGDKPVTIIGVTPPEFYGLYPDRAVDISLPVRMEHEEKMAHGSGWWFWSVGRLKPGIEVEHARVELDTIYKTYINDIKNFGALKFFDRIELASASKGLNTLRRQFSRPLLALMTIVALVLLIACANVANLLLARATARRKEFAVRLALGASRLRLLRQMLTESLLLVSLGGLLGLLFARWGSAALVNLLGLGQGRLFVNPPLDHRVLLFTIGVALLTGLIFGLAPALQAARIDPNPTLKDNAGTISIGRLRVGKSLIVAQVGISLLLLVGAGLFLRTLYNLKNVDAGFQSDGVLTISVKPDENIYQGTQLSSLWKDLLSRVERLPGVRSASLSDRIPLNGGSLGIAVNIPGYTPSSDQDRIITLNHVSPGYFQTTGIALLNGRVFNDSDSETAPKVALLNESAARFYFGDRNPIGEQITIIHKFRDYQVVGVVKDSRYHNLREPDTRMIYLPIQQPLDPLKGLALVARAGARPTELINPIRNEVRAAGSGILLTNIATLSEQVDRTLVQERSIATLSLIFGLLALLLAAIGLYGVMSYDVARRTHEIGIRMALGAGGRQVRQLVMRETLGWVALGVTLGLGAALATTRWVESLLFGLKPRDPLTMGLAVLVLLAVAAVAGYLPARRATRVDPLDALRRE
jgi:predicted permease